MINITILGTSGMMPTRERNHSSIFIERNGEGILFDCGEGTQRQFKQAGISPTKIDKIFISHWHGDHVLGIPGLIQTLAGCEYTGTLEIYGPENTKEKMKKVEEAFRIEGEIDYIVKELSNDEKVRGEDYQIKSYDLEHGINCIGYTLIEDDKRKIDMEKAEEKGLNEGPVIGDLKEGKTVDFEGEKIKPEEVSYIEEGIKIGYISDTRPCKGTNNIAENADLLISESTYKSDMLEKAEEYNHLTAKEAAEIAKENNAGKLVLTHFSTRYKNEKELEDDARKIFDDTKAAVDLMEIKI